MEQERNEVYERIPWETIDRRGRDRQWIVMALAGAVAIGALAYSFARSQPSAPADPEPFAAAGQSLEEASPMATPTVSPTTIAAPQITAEADLYAVDPEALADQAKAHAEWFAVEYFTVDGSEQSKTTLASLMPAGVPMPEAPPGTQVFVDWVRAQAVTETAPLRYQVEVVVRSMLATSEQGFTRQPTVTALIDIALGEDGHPHVIRPPRIEPMSLAVPAGLTLSPLPPEMEAQLIASHGTVVGGEPLPGGGWLAVVMVEGSDGVRRPVSLRVP